MTREPRPEGLTRAQQALPKRFYKAASAGERDGAFALLLDGRPARTPAKFPLAFPNAGIAEAVAAEWDAQVEIIDPRTMPMTRIANVAIDGVATASDAVADEIVTYAGTDLVCYRAEGPDRLVARQGAHWDPLLAFARDALGARFMLSAGVMFVEQPAHAIEAVRRAVPRDDVFALASLSVITTLTGSALIALALLRGAISPEEAWAAANVDDDWNAELWGEDAEATARTANRRIEMFAAAEMLRLAGG